MEFITCWLAKDTNSSQPLSVMNVSVNKGRGQTARDREEPRAGNHELPLV